MLAMGGSMYIGGEKDDQRRTGRSHPPQAPAEPCHQREANDHQRRFVMGDDIPGLQDQGAKHSQRNPGEAAQPRVGNTIATTHAIHKPRNR